MLMNYYQKQLDLLRDPISDQFIHPNSLILYDGCNNSTNQLDLNTSSIPIIIEYLTKLLEVIE